MQRSESLLSLTAVKFLERFAYYGMRSIVVLYAVAEYGKGLNMSRSDAFSMYGWFTMFVYMTPLLCAPISDLFLKNRNATLIGFGLTLLGMILLTLTVPVLFFVGLFLIALGIGFTGPVLVSSVAKLYKKSDQGRDVGFMIFYLGINAGAFVSALVVGSVGELLGFNLGFATCAGAVLVAGILYLATSNRIGDEELIEHFVLKELKRPNYISSRTVMAFVVISSVGLFWGSYELVYRFYYEYINLDFDIAGFSIPKTWWYSLNPIFIFVFSLIFIIWWLNGKQLSTPIKFGLSMLTFASALAFILLINIEFPIGMNSANGGILSSLFLFYMFSAIAELFISPIALSYITRLSPVKWTATFIGLYFCGTGLANKVAGTLAGATMDLPAIGLLTFIMVLLVAVGLTYMLLRKYITKSTGLDQNINEESNESIWNE